MSTQESLISKISKALYEIHFHKGDSLEPLIEYNQALKMIKEILDKNDEGFDEEDKVIINWEINRIEDADKLLDYIFSKWNTHFGTAKKIDELGLYLFTTGGWSTNEHLIYCLKQNIMAWNYLWWHSIILPGGFYLFSTKSKLTDRLANEIVERTHSIFDNLTLNKKGNKNA